MRGSGKTFVGNIAASTLSWTFVDADAYFEEKYQIGLRQFVHDKGWEAFRAAELSILEELLAKKCTRHVISLGGGIVETPAARELLKAYANKNGLVVHVMRDRDEIENYLSTESARPAYGESVREVYRRREPWFQECCSHVFVNHVSLTNNKIHVRDEASRFFRHITGQQPNLAPNIASGRRSYFLSLTYPDVTQALSHLDHLTEGVDAVELRVDLLRESKDRESGGPYIPSGVYVSDQVAALHRATPLPIVFTVRTVSQGGSFPDSAQKEACDLLDLALRLGVEYVDVEITLPQKRIRELNSRKGSS
jgi:pentafunctional AROM polypeptide